MKFIIVLAYFLAVAYADSERSAHVASEDAEVNPDGFKYAFKTTNNIEANQDGHLKDEHTIYVQGSYSYKSPDGKVVHVEYTADEHGYHPKVHV